MPKLKNKMCLPCRLWKNKKDDFCRFNEEHSLIKSGFIQFLGLTVFEQVSLKVFTVFRAVCTVYNQMEHLQSKLDSTDGIEHRPEHVQRERCAKRENFFEELYKFKSAFNKARAELYKEVSDPDLLVTVDGVNR